MDIREKVAEALRRRFAPDRMVLRDDNGIYGYIVSDKFLGLTSLERQREIDRTFRDAAANLSRAERLNILVIAPITPEEYEGIEPDGPIRGIESDPEVAPASVTAGV